jgi:hypothetical protein
VEIKNPYHWSRRSVKDILGRSVYCGYWTKTVQGEELHFTNEPLIPETMYETAQKMMKETNRPCRTVKPKHKYHKLLLDKQYGYAFRYRTDRQGYGYYKYAATDDTAQCGRKRLLEEEIDCAVFNALRNAHREAVAVGRRIELEGAAYLEKQGTEIKLRLLRQGEILAESERKKMEAYRGMESGAISRQTYEEAAEKARAVAAGVEETFRVDGGRLERMEQAVSINNPWVKLFSGWTDTEEVTRELLEKYVERIETEQLCISSVVLKENGWYLELPENWRKLEPPEDEKNAGL